MLLEGKEPMKKKRLKMLESEENGQQDCRENKLVLKRERTPKMA